MDGRYRYGNCPVDRSLSKGLSTRQQSGVYAVPGQASEFRCQPRQIAGPRAPHRDDDDLLRQADRALSAASACPRYRRAFFNESFRCSCLRRDGMGFILLVLRRGPLPLVPRRMCGKIAVSPGHLCHQR